MSALGHSIRGHGGKSARNAISTADDLAIWMRALVRGKIFDADHQRQWLDSLEPEDPSNPSGQKYGFGIIQITFGPNSVYFHGGEMPGYNSFMVHDPVNDSRWEPEAANSEPYPNKGTRCLGATRACARRFKSWARTLAGGKSFGGRITTPAKTD
jgi:hypothetical protein